MSVHGQAMDGWLLDGLFITSGSLNAKGSRGAEEEGSKWYRIRLPTGREERRGEEGGKEMRKEGRNSAGSGRNNSAKVTPSCRWEWEEVGARRVERSGEWGDRAPRMKRVEQETTPSSEPAWHLKGLHLPSTQQRGQARGPAPQGLLGKKKRKDLSS